MGKTDKTAGQVPRRSIVLKISIFIALAFVVILGLLVGYFAYSIRTASQNIQEQQLRVMRVHTQQISAAADNANVSLKAVSYTHLKGTQVAKDLNALGYQCFQLLNRTNQNPWTQKEAGVDAARAVRMVRKNAEKYRIDPRKVAFAGFSNGGLTGEGLIQYFSGKQAVKDAFPDYRPDELDELDATPAANLCIYGPRFVGDPFDYENVVYPPTFFAVGREDAAMDNLRYVYPDLKAHGVEAEVHTFAGVPHGMAGDKVFTGRVDYPNFELWIPLADAFMQDVYKKL